MNGRLATMATMILCALSLSACSDDGGEQADDSDAGAQVDAAGELRSFPVTHVFPRRSLEAGKEEVVCAQWTFENDKPLYVNSVTMGNDGGFHHSNWYIVPESFVAGEDGYFDCDSRGWSQQAAALAGGVLFAQSTQARSETQAFPESVAVKVPPNFKVVGDVHFLNASPNELDTGIRMELGIIHPGDVDKIATPFQLVYSALDIPPNTESRFTAECNIRGSYEAVTRDSFDIEIYYVLPHYHSLGNYFGLEIYGGDRDGEEIFELSGFNAEANGQTLSPPVDLTGAKGFRFSCGFDNPRDEAVGWGIGDQEMCIMLGFSSGSAIFEGAVREGNEVVETRDGVVHNTGPCTARTVPRNRAQGMPSDEEIDAPLYIPESHDDSDVDVVPECVDTPDDAVAVGAATLRNIEDSVFAVSCAYSACHDSTGPAAGLDLTGDTYEALMTHEPLLDTDLPLVAPGDAEGSWLYQMVSNCQPQTNSGPARSMPLSYPTLLEPELVALLRDWIDAGAQDN